jgi:hypothetical protein
VKPTGTTAAPGKTSTTSGGNGGGTEGAVKGGGGNASTPADAGGARNEYAGPPTTVNVRELTLGPNNPGIIPDDYVQRQDARLTSPEVASIPNAEAFQQPNEQRFGG